VQNGNGRIRFGAFEADLHAGEVRKAGSRVKLQDQPFKVLQILLERPGDLVTREELRSSIWPEDSFGDFDHAVNVAVGKLRAALGDSADNPSFIETVPRRGYRFVAKLEEPPAAALPAPAPPPRRAAGAPDSATPGSATPDSATLGSATPDSAAPRSAAPDSAAPDGAGAGIAADAGAALAAPRRRRRTLPTVAAAAGCAILLAAAFFLGRRTAQSPPPDFQPLTVSHGTVYAARFAPDGHNVIYAAAWDGAPIEIFSTDPEFRGVRSLGLPATQLLAISSSGAMAVMQSVEHRFLLTLSGILSQVPLAGGSPRQVAENVDWADWSPDGATLAAVREVAGKQRLEFPLGHVLYETAGWIGHPRLSPRGDRIAFLDHPTYPDDRGSVAVVDLAGGKKTLSNGWESEEGLAWAPDGNEVWFSAARAGLERRIYAADLSGRLHLVLRAPGGVTLQDIAPDGRVLLTRDEQRVRMMARARDTGTERELSWHDWSVPMDLSADGSTVLFDEQGVESGPTYTVAVRDMRGSPPIPLGEGMAGALSPDGKWATANVANARLMVLPTGAGTARQIARGDIQQYWHGAEWLPDGKQIVFSGTEPGRAVRCYLQSLDGGPPRPVTPEGMTLCQVSPDGKRLAASGRADGSAWLYDLPSPVSPASASLSPPHPIPGLLPGDTFTWSSDPHFGYAYQAKQIPVRVSRLNVVNGERQPFVEVTPPNVPGLCDVSHLRFSADGRAYVYRYTQLLSELYLVKGLAHP
jgi:DNA-binding winged helix-turn-helix (wHTH) protein/Tol biopolymer transport system component